MVFSARSDHWLSPGMALVVSGSIALVIVVCDVFSPVDYQLPVLYVIPVILASWTVRARYLWAVALFLILADVLALWIGFRPPVPGLPSALVSRLLAALSVLGVAALATARMLGAEALRTRQRTLQEQNAALEAANRDLNDREEEIVRQNEELQAQTEELERQTEELRITNEELANREKTLEQLLQLSRSLSADLPRDEMLKRICEALGVLTSGMASAILQRDDSELRLPCHHGFGAEGPQSELLPYEHSFASLIMSLGQAGYLEDVLLRPDLTIPQPRTGERFRSVLSSPLRVHSQCVGTIEIYATQRQTWTEAQIAMLESLAAQASISLQSAELVEGIRRERTRFEAAFHTVPFGMAVADDPGAEHVRLNPAAAALFNVAVDENVALGTPAGIRLRRFLYRNDRTIPNEEVPLQRALRGQETSGEEIDVVFPGGRHAVLLVSAAPIYRAKGSIAGAVCAFVDITARKQLQRELEIRRREAEEANVRKTRFLASVSHDIRTPVNAINLMAEVIRRMAGTPQLAAQIPEAARKLQANAVALVELVSDVLDIARFDSGKVELLESEFLLNELVHEECQQAKPLAEDKRIELEFPAGSRPIWLRTDRVKLGRVLGNLIGNAIKFTDQGRVQVSFDLDEERRAVLRVSDTGLGIAPDQLSRIFDEFSQVNNPERNRNKGAGLGLAICRRLVEVMGGTITVTSTPNQGSIFSVTLPASVVALRLDASLGARTQEAPPVSSGGSAALAGLRVLLVEDHDATRESTGLILRAEGASVMEASDGETALQLLQTQPTDILLLDMMMPFLDGREVLKRLQGKRPPSLKAVFVLTGDMTQERLEEVQRLGADALIGKPIDIHQLIAKLHTVQRSSASK